MTYIASCTSYVASEVRALGPTVFLTRNKLYVTIINVRYTLIMSLGVRNLH